MCEDISIADDFDVWLGVVSGGVSLLIRPAETNPTSPDIFQMPLSTLSNVPCGINLCPAVWRWFVLLWEMIWRVSDLIFYWTSCLELKSGWFRMSWRVSDFIFKVGMSWRVGDSRVSDFIRFLQSHLKSEWIFSLMIWRVSNKWEWSEEWVINGEVWPEEWVIVSEEWVTICVYEWRFVGEEWVRNACRPSMQFTIYMNW